MAPKLYMIPASSPARSVLLCAKAVGLELDLVSVNMFKGEHYTPEYAKINPRRTIPTFVDDDGFILTDSHAIMPYIVGKYGKDKSLYPEDLKKRALIDQRLHFDSNLLFIIGLNINKGLALYGKTEILEEEKMQFRDAYKLVDKFLEGNDWVAGDSLSIADFSFVTSITSWSFLEPYDESKYPNMCAWLKRMETLPYYEEANVPGLYQYRDFLKAKLKDLKDSHL